MSGYLIGFGFGALFAGAAICFAVYSPTDPHLYVILANIAIAMLAFIGAGVWRRQGEKQ